ncbi:MAG: hypothetical protein ACOC1X_00270, partial [Promethearchaeota archaeon]
NVSLILDLRNSNIFDNFGSNTRVLLRLTIEDINFTSNTQTLYIEGFRNQLTTNPEVSANSVNFNETFYYNSELISQDTVDINPNYQISEDYQNTNSTETDIQFSYKSDVPINNVTYTPTLNIEGMFDNSWQLNNNFSSINFALNPLNFTETLQTKTLQTNLTQTTSNPTTSIDSVYYNLRVYDNSDVLLTKSLDIDPGFSTDFSYYIANSMYSKIRLDYLANIHCENVTHKISIDILQAFGNNWELNTNLTTYQITINEIDFTDTINYLDISSNLTQITANPTTSTDSVDFRFKYYRGSNLLLQSDLDIDPGFQVSYTVENSTTFSIAGKVRYKADLNISNVDLHLNKKRSNMFNDLLTLNNNQDNNNVSLTLSNLSFTEVLQTTYICGNRVQLNASARTDLDSVHFTETYTWNNSTLNSYTINVDPNFYVSYDIITTQSKYTKLKITYRADLAINNVSLILNLNDYCFGVNFTLVSTKITINELNFRASSKYFYIEGYRTQHTRNPRTDQETVQFNQTFYYSGNMIKTSTVSIDPQWQISYEILVNNGTYSKLRITYSSILSLNDVSIVLDLTNSSCYNENWTLSAYQDLDFILTIPNIDFTTQSQRIYIEGFSSIPYATITGFESDQNFNRLAIDEEVEFVAFLNFSKFSEIFLINISKNWECFYVFYPNDTYNVQYINDYQIQFSGKGFDPKVNSSYLYFKTKPFSTVNFTYSNDNDTIEIVIYSEFDVNNSYFFHRFNDESNHELVILYNTTSITGLSDYGDYEGYLFFKCNNITEGYTVIVIYVDKAEGIEFWIQAIPILAIAGISVGVFYYLKFNEKALEKIKSFVSDKVIDRLKRNEGQLENVKISQKGDEINIKFKD